MVPSKLLAAARGEAVAPTPVWFMRQAGRSLPEYRAVRGDGSILEAIKQPELAAEITLQPVRRYGVDAAVLYSDIVVPAHAIGFGIDAVASHRLERDLGRQLRLLDGLENRALAAYGAVLGQAAAGLAHEPNRSPGRHAAGCCSEERAVRRHWGWKLSRPIELLDPPLEGLQRRVAPTQNRNHTGRLLGIDDAAPP